MRVQGTGFVATSDIKFSAAFFHKNQFWRFKYIYCTHRLLIDAFKTKLDIRGESKPQLRSNCCSKVQFESIVILFITI